MVDYARVKYTVEIEDIVKNNPDYFGNQFLLELKKKSHRSFLLEMGEMYLLEKPFFEKFAFVGLFRMDLNSWEKQSYPLTQLGLYNAFKNSLTSSPAYYNGELKEKMEDYASNHTSTIVESFFDGDWDNISREEYFQLKDKGKTAYKISDLDIDKKTNLTNKNPLGNSKVIKPIVDNLSLLKMFQELLESGVDPKSLNNSLKKTIKLMENSIDLFKEDEPNGYSVEKQWCIRIYGSVKTGLSYARWFKSKNEAYVFMKKILRDRSMSKIQSQMICMMP